MATKCKDCYLDCLVIKFAMFITMVYYHGPHVIYVLSITLSPALAEKYSSLCLGVRNSKTSLYLFAVCDTVSHT